MSELKTVGDHCNFLELHGFGAHVLNENLIQNSKALKELLQNSTPNAKMQELIDYVENEYNTNDTRTPEYYEGLDFCLGLFKELLEVSK